MEKFKIEMKGENDRLAVATLLIKNGYTVRQGKELKSPTSKTYNYYVYAEKGENK